MLEFIEHGLSRKELKGKFKILKRLSLIVWVNIVLNRTVVVEMTPEFKPFRVLKFLINKKGI